MKGRCITGMNGTSSRFHGWSADTGDYLWTETQLSTSHWTTNSSDAVKTMSEEVKMPTSIPSLQITQLTSLAHGLAEDVPLQEPQASRGKLRVDCFREPLFFIFGNLVPWFVVPFQCASESASGVTRPEIGSCVLP